MKGLMKYQKENEESIKQLLIEFGLKYIRTLNSVNYIVFNYKQGEELNAVAMAMKAQNLSGLRLEQLIKRISKEVVS